MAELPSKDTKMQQSANSYIFGNIFIDLTQEKGFCPEECREIMPQIRELNPKVPYHQKVTLEGSEPFYIEVRPSMQVVSKTIFISLPEVLREARDAKPVTMRISREIRYFGQTANSRNIINFNNDPRNSNYY